MKSILIVIYAHYVKLIIEGKKTIELRKNKNLANAIKRLIAEQGGCWVYIYVAKGHEKLYLPFEFDCFEQDEASKPYLSKEPILDVDYLCNGKVVARFWCDKVIPSSYTNCLQGSCLSYEQVKEYTKGKEFVGIHISKLEVFEKPREISEFTFYRECQKKYCEKYACWECPMFYKKSLTKAPQNYCYVEDGLK